MSHYTIQAGPATAPRATPTAEDKGAPETAAQESPQNLPHSESNGPLILSVSPLLDPAMVAMWKHAAEVAVKYAARYMRRAELLQAKRARMIPIALNLREKAAQNKSQPSDADLKTLQSERNALQEHNAALSSGLADIRKALDTTGCTEGNLIVRINLLSASHDEYKARAIAAEQTIRNLELQLSQMGGQHSRTVKGLHIQIEQLENQLKAVQK